MTTCCARKREASVLPESKHTNLHQRRRQNLLLYLRRILQYIFRIIKEIDGMWNQNNIRTRMLRVPQFQRRWSRCSGTELFLAKKMEQWNSGDWKQNLRRAFHSHHIGQFNYDQITWKLETDEGHKKRFQLSTDSNRQTNFDLRTVQGHSGEFCGSVLIG